MDGPELFDNAAQPLGRRRHDELVFGFEHRRADCRQCPVAIYRGVVRNFLRLPQSHRGQIKDEGLQKGASRLAAARQHLDKVFLIGLSKGQPIDHALLSK